MAIPLRISRIMILPPGSTGAATFFILRFSMNTQLHEFRHDLIPLK
jgi:hypothetical protein